MIEHDVLLCNELQLQLQLVQFIGYTCSIKKGGAWYLVKPSSLVALHAPQTVQAETSAPTARPRP